MRARISYRKVHDSEDTTYLACFVIQLDALANVDALAIEGGGADVVFGIGDVGCR